MGRWILMAGKVLLDTNIVIAHIDGEKAVNDRVKQISESFISTVVMGELFYGAMKSQKTSSNIFRLEKVVEEFCILPCDITTAKVYGLVKNEMKTKGNPIPENDLWIAAIARQHGLILATRDVHFSKVPELQVEKW